MDVPTAYVDDTDAYFDFEVTDRTGASLTFTANVGVDSGTYSVVGTWQGTAAAVRVLRVPTSGMAAGGHNLYLQVPSGPDFFLGRVLIKTRSTP